MQRVHLVHPARRPAGAAGVGLVLALPDCRGGRPRRLPEPGLGRGVGAVQDLAVERQLGLQLRQVVAAIERLGGLRARGDYSAIDWLSHGHGWTHVIPEGGHLPQADPPGAADEVGRVIRVGNASMSVQRHRRRRGCNEGPLTISSVILIHSVLRCLEHN